MEKKKVFFLAGDPSGDIHASHIVKELSKQFVCTGIGGPEMVAAGFNAILPFKQFNRMGFWEVLRGLPFLLSARKKIFSYIRTELPAVLVLVDYPGLNIQVLKFASQLGIPVVWYIPPKVWAWKKKRAEILGTHAAFIGAIFPFECDWYRAYPAKIRFVGNPLVEALESKYGTTLREVPEQVENIAIVPGSRVQEITRILPAMMEAYTLIKKDFPYIRAQVSCCSWIDKELYRCAEGYPDVELSYDGLEEIYRWAHTGLVTSGTATLEAALHGVPCVVVYKTSALSYRLFKLFITIPYISLPNIIARKELIPECIQHKASPSILAGHLRSYLSNPDYYKKVFTALIELKDILGSQKPSEQIPAEILSILRS